MVMSDSYCKKCRGQVPLCDNCITLRLPPDEFVNTMEGLPIYDHDDGERMAKRIVSLESELSQLKAEKWISVEDRLPEMDAYCLVYRVNRGFSPTNIMISQYGKYGFEVGPIIYWQKLPEPPQ